MKSNKKYLSLLLAVVSIICCFSVVVANADDTVLLNAANFPDATFRTAIAEYYDQNGDGRLSTEERSCTFMTITGMIDTDIQEIKDLTGIEFFSELRILRCGGIGLESLDISGLSNLTSLTCSGNWLTSLDITSNAALQELNCSDNDISVLTMPYTNQLTKLHCYANELTSIDVHKLINLEDLRCDQNELTSLNLTTNGSLKKLNCSGNHLTTLDLSTNTSLADVTNYMIGNQNIELTAALYGQEIRVPFTNHQLSSKNYVCCSIDGYSDGSYFDFSKFVTDDVAAIKNGIDYECSTGLAGSENMSVHINVIRDSFCQVDFYSSETLENRVGKYLVAIGAAATAPEAPEAPLCKAFDSWSDTLTDITEDKSVYALWTDAHTYDVTGFDGVYVTLTCRDCTNTITVKFTDVLNSATGDINYYAAIDVNSDNWINAKDFAILKKQFA